MNWKDFLKPTWKKIAFSVIIFFMILFILFLFAMGFRGGCTIMFPGEKTPDEYYYNGIKYYKTNEIVNIFVGLFSIFEMNSFFRCESLMSNLMLFEAVINAFFAALTSFLIACGIIIKHKEKNIYLTSLFSCIAFATFLYKSILWYNSLEGIIFQNILELLFFPQLIFKLITGTSAWGIEEFILNFLTLAWWFFISSSIIWFYDKVKRK